MFLFCQGHLLSSNIVVRSHFFMKSKIITIEQQWQQQRRLLWCLPACLPTSPSVRPSIYRDHHRTLVFTVLPAEVSFIKTLPARLVADHELWSLYCGKTWGDNFPTEINNMYRPWRSMILKRRAGCTIYETIIQNVCVCDERESHKHRLIKCNVGEIWNE